MMEKFRGRKVVQQGIGIYSTNFPWHVMLNYNLLWFGTRWVIIPEISCLKSETDLILYGREVQQGSEGG